jgi:hypothetical protein
MKRITDVDNENWTRSECLNKISLWNKKIDLILHQWSQIMNRTKNEWRMNYYLNN